MKRRSRIVWAVRVTQRGRTRLMHTIYTIRAIAREVARIRRGGGMKATVLRATLVLPRQRPANRKT